MEEDNKPEVSFKKRVFRNKGSRKRHGSSEDEKSDGETKIIKGTKKIKPNLLTQTSKKCERKEKLDDSSSDSLDEDEVNRVMVSYKSTREAQRTGPDDMGATATLETETEKDRDAQAIFENAMKINKELKGRYISFVFNGKILIQLFYISIALLFSLFQEKKMTKFTEALTITYNIMRKRILLREMHQVGWFGKDL